MAMAFVMAHPGVTSAILGPRTMQQLDDLLAGAAVVLERRNPGPDRRGRCARNRCRTDGRVYTPPAVTQASLRRRPVAERAPRIQFKRRTPHAV
jgi:hypothetical protein